MNILENQSYYIFLKKVILLYNSKCSSVHTSETFLGETWYSLAPIQIKCLNFLVKIPLTKEHLFYKYFVRLYVGNIFSTTYGLNCPCRLLYPNAQTQEKLNILKSWISLSVCIFCALFLCVCARFECVCAYVGVWILTRVKSQSVIEAFEQGKI